ncbi:hypothetical protein GCM10010191_43140 [Actinomadura vinacea]|uniref:Ricin B lectin domain-containing protein n=1 Tax=Actinomadura vinacea TaxID=115336 RepID=A0ABN3JDN8_9ACTN
MVVGVLLVVALIWAIANNQDKPDSPATAQVSSPRPSATEPSTPAPDPTYEAFDEVSSGDCLDAYADPYDFLEWRDLPNVVDCDRSDAYVRVTGVHRSLGECDADDLEGEDQWGYSGGGDRIYLCLERQFRVGECFLGEKGEREGRIYITRHGLMTSWDCGKNTLPKKFDHVLQVTALTSGRCPSGSLSWDFRDGNLCARAV